MTVTQTPGGAAMRKSSASLWAITAYDALASGLAFALAFETGMVLAGQSAFRSLVIHSAVFTLIGLSSLSRTLP